MHIYFDGTSVWGLRSGEGRPTLGGGVFVGSWKRQIDEPNLIVCHWEPGFVVADQTLIEWVIYVRHE